MNRFYFINQNKQKNSNLFFKVVNNLNSRFINDRIRIELLIFESQFRNVSKFLRLLYIIYSNSFIFNSISLLSKNFDKSYKS